MATPRPETYAIASGADLWAGRDAPIPAWVPSTLFEAALVPMTNELGDVESRGVWSYTTGNGVAFSAYSGGVYNPYYGAHGAVIVHGGGHSAGDDNSVIIANLNTLAFERIGDPTNLQALGRWADYRVGSWPGLDTNTFKTSYDYFAVRGPNSTGWNDPTNSALWEFATSSETTAEYVQGTGPASVHSYGNLLILPPGVTGDPLGTLLRPVSTAPANTPQVNAGQAHAFGCTSRAWSRFGSNKLDRNAVTNSSGCSYDHTRNRVLHIGTGTQFGWLDCTSGAWTLLSGASGLASGVVCTYHALRDIHVLAFGNASGRVRMQYIPGGSLSAAARTDVTWTNGQAPPILAGGTIMDCPERGSMFFYTRGHLDKLWEVTVPANPANAWTYTEHTMTGANRPSQLSPGPAQSVYGRFGYSPQLKSLVWVTGQYGAGGPDTDPTKFGGRVLCVRVVE